MLYMLGKLLSNFFHWGFHLSRPLAKKGDVIGGICPDCQEQFSVRAHNKLIIGISKGSAREGYVTIENATIYDYEK